MDVAPWLVGAVAGVVVVIVAARLSVWKQEKQDRYDRKREAERAELQRQLRDLARELADYRAGKR